MEATKEMAEAVKQIRLAELRSALGIITATTVSKVAGTLPLYSEMIKATMPARRAHAAAALRVIAQELQKVATELTDKAPA